MINIFMTNDLSTARRIVISSGATVEVQDHPY